MFFWKICADFFEKQWSVKMTSKKNSGLQPLACLWPLLVVLARLWTILDAGGCQSVEGGGYGPLTGIEYNARHAIHRKQKTDLRVCEITIQD